MRFEVRQTIEREIHFAGRAAILVTLEIVGKIIRQVFFANHLHERQTRIDARRNHVRVNLIAIFQHDAFGLSVLQNDLCDRRFGANLRAGFARRVGNRI